MSIFCEFCLTHFDGNILSLYL